MIRHILPLALSLAFLAVVSSPSAAQRQADVQAIDRFLDRFAGLEDEMDEAAQAALMSDDRVWIAQGMGRRTNQQLNTRIQDAQQQALKQTVPGIKFFTDYRDRVIRIYGEGRVAVASFYAYTTAVVPPGTPTDIATAVSTIPPQVFTLVLEKRGADWKVVHVHFSDLSGSSGT